MGSSRSKWGPRPVIKLFWCSNDFITQIVFLAVNAFAVA
jgi:hypothetical protein